MTDVAEAAEANDPTSVAEADQPAVDALLEELDDIRPALAHHQAEAKRLSGRRKDILVALRGLGVQDKVMAEHTGQQVGTVTQAIREHRLRLAGNPITRKKD